jgi:NAD(P)-dependent dehydrogenase (short-subunit alcohol dehydrogenase family)
MKFSGKLAIVTGGESGIGAATAIQLASEGARVVVAGLNLEGGTHVVEAIRKEKGEASFVTTDVSSTESVEALAALVRDTYGVPDLIVNSAGMALVKPIHTTTDDELEQVLGVNVKGICRVVRAFVTDMGNRGTGSIVNVASQLGFVAAPNFAIYSASKGAVINLTRAMALDYAPWGIRINSVCPGAVETPLLLNQFKETTGPQGTIQDLIAMHPLGRLGRPDEIAKAILFLLSEDASFATGESLVIDGGYVAQ